MDACPSLGGWFTEAEIEALLECVRESMDWRRGFSGPEIEQFEEAFAQYCGVEHAVALGNLEFRARAAAHAVRAYLEAENQYAETMLASARELEEELFA